MTVMAERMSRTSQMSVEEFERIAVIAAKETDDAVRFEFIGGRIGVKKVTDGDHNTIVMWLTRRCMQARSDLDLYQGQGLRVERYREGRARPDGILAPEAHFAGHGDWADPAGVLLVLEVTSYDSDTDLRDRQEKPAAYGEAGIPVYLLIDRDACTVTVHSHPDREDGGYRDTHTVKFGEKVTIPDPVGIELDTETLKNYVR
ncbi:Uma2 family endonuclease [Streptomyces himalayensis]|uniref:Uma2 family endonuclease n=1 Tax=Streptomyces himalayensis subsp. himalayensis TaxID=2756131 RepID=A0A7W0DI02_9ACTN|nr:Uma2 family endonuclease [Streptomyces himalayensis]MBA2945150.1 Uma2 family endonuclease [Streptomyces himalayensis subsp. himalayensis]